VGPYSVKKPLITFAEDTEGLMASKDYAGLIGAEFLQRFTVTFDNPGKVVRLAPNRDYAKPAEYDESGLRIRGEGPGFHRFVVGRVLPKSPAAEAGIQPGDVIEVIGDSPAERMTLSEVRSMLRRPDVSYSIGILRGILRGGRRIRVEIRMCSRDGECFSGQSN
jgi:S1-C subfamily serine protease